MPSLTKHNQAWTKDDIAVLREMYRKHVVHREIAAKLKRTLVAVESKATELGLAQKRAKKK